MRNGAKTKFQDDIWVGNGPLKDKYPRLYALTVEKSGYIVDSGLWDEDSWQWILPWRRRLFVWEKELESQLLQTLNTVMIRQGFEDGVKWKWIRDGKYSVRSCMEAVCNSSAQPILASNVIKLIWCNKTPRRAQLLIWLLLSKKMIKTCDQLHKLGVINIDNASFPFCNLQIKTLDNLFFTCQRI